MTAFITKSSLSLIILFGIYWFLLRKEKLFNFNRFFLIFSILFSLMVPFISIPINTQNKEIRESIITAFNNNTFTFSPAQNPENNIINQSHTEIYTVNKGLSSEVTFFGIIKILYVSGVIVLLFRFIRNLYLIFHLMRLSEKTNYSGRRLILIEKQINPYCFFNTIFQGSPTTAAFARTLASGRISSMIPKRAFRAGLSLGKCTMGFPSKSNCLTHSSAGMTPPKVSPVTRSCSCIIG